MTKTSIRLLVLLGILTFAVAALTRPGAADATTHNVAMLAEIDDFRSETWRWQRLMMKPRTPTNYSERETTSTTYHAWIRSLWRSRAEAAERLAKTPPRQKQWLCIHRHERNPQQGWRTRTGNGYYGGLQMDIEFQRMYGADLLRRKGTADRWSPIEQIWVAERAYRSGRGFYPWPNTARSCGLI